jgi:hypothetical protein
MNTGLIIGIISLSLVSIVAVVVVVIRMNKKTSPTPTSEPTITQNKVLTKVPPKDYTKLYYLSPSRISEKGISGYMAIYIPDPTYFFGYSLLNTSPYNITKVGVDFETSTDAEIWLYKLDKDKIESPSNEWTRYYSLSSQAKLYIHDILIKPGESFVINMKQVSAIAKVEIKFVEVLLPV